ncbi:DNA-formamidopyrimidine glycosylase [Desemzia sp. RIT804]|uniref:DNA-formamidopyrimidine glycosylase n=1 Tax=Desemzia sp. RIT 804 TaxID=2810209 RepID=UPI00194E452D|nr:DNA-formamidopyrimidine glycosylase [Desemzia sp. RIT 804]MBM6613435.1 DNA-formamidopyrimidine glycosylase [Desemzia sp. RIT 804]
MPELPEVETVRKGLEATVDQVTIQKVSVYWDRIIAGTVSSESFQEVLVGETLRKFRRRGKFLLLDFDHYTLISHLRMEGKYEVVPTEEKLKKHTHVIFHLTDGRDIRYLDVRKFGRMELVPLGKETSVAGIKRLGPEPFEDVFLLEPFQGKLSRVKKAIKPALLDQGLVTGLGNIYVDEALFQAEIHPLRPGNSLKPFEVKRLHQAIIQVLGNAIKAGGTTIRTYLNALGEAGQFQQKLAVYGRTGQSCVNCDRPIQKVKVAQRGTHYCAHCQELTEKNVLPVKLSEVEREN